VPSHVHDCCSPPRHADIHRIYRTDYNTHSNVCSSAFVLYDTELERLSLHDGPVNPEIGTYNVIQHP
jgi:hypothetical protein